MMLKIVTHVACSMLKDVHTSKPKYSMDNTQDITSKLKFIGRLKKGEKINTRHMYVQPTGFGTSISRTFFNQDNRGNALSFCQETISRSFELVVTYERSTRPTDAVLLNNILNDLRASMVGLNNLKCTYVNDTKFCCDMDTLLQIVTARLSKYEERKLIEPIETKLSPPLSED